jgi:asparagine synthase (glutamine-hydrolysing)
MCGIAGMIDSVAGRAEARVALINDSQAHRGPDHHVQARVGVFTLGNTRLAIQDPSPAGNQPFVSADGRYHCVFNGEIYNYRRLIDRYHLPVRSNCDGEVIPALWAKLGHDSLAELRGMFAIALVDAEEERLYLARDPFGIKPLYWRALPDGSLAFASEVRPLALLASGVRLDGDALAGYLQAGAMARDQSPFLEVRALPPNTAMTLDRDRQLAAWPILPDGPLNAPGSSADLGATLTDSIDLQLCADVPTALLLSAGVDSSAIAAVGRRLGRELHCLTVATEGSADESGAAARTAGHYGHQFQRIPARLDSGDLAGFFGAMQRPSIDGLNTYLVCKAVREAGFKVAVSGIGGDEVVGGYSHFRLLRYLPAIRAMRALGPLTTLAAKGLAHLGVAGEAKLGRLLSPGGPSDGKGLVMLQREVLAAPLVADLTGIARHRSVAMPVAEGECPPGSFGAMTAAEVAIYLQAMLLPDADAFSMAASVELRVPFIDTDVFAASLGLALRDGGRPGKTAIGTALRDPYLLDLAARPKRGFSVPMRTWLTGGPLAPALRAAGEPDAPIWSVIDRAAADRAGLLPLRAGTRWSEAWTFAALNAWLGSVTAGIANL